MAFSEALSDDGKLSGRGNPWVRGPVCGVMTVSGCDRTYAAVYVVKFRTGDPYRRRRRNCRIAGDRVDSAPVYGHAIIGSHFHGCRWRADRVRRGNLDRQRLVRTALRDEVRAAKTFLTETGFYDCQLRKSSSRPEISFRFFSKIPKSVRIERPSKMPKAHQGQDVTDIACGMPNHCDNGKQNESGSQIDKRGESAT